MRNESFSRDCFKLVCKQPWVGTTMRLVLICNSFDSFSTLESIFEFTNEWYANKWVITPPQTPLLSVQVYIGLLKDAMYLVNGGLKMILSFGTISNNWIDFFVVVAAIFDFSLFLNFIPRGKVSSFCHFSKTDETKSGYPESKKRIWFTDWLTE